MHILLCTFYIVHCIYRFLRGLFLYFAAEKGQNLQERSNKKHESVDLGSITVWLKSESVGGEIVQPFDAFLFGYKKSRKKMF